MKRLVRVSVLMAAVLLTACARDEVTDPAPNPPPPDPDPVYWPSLGLNDITVLWPLPASPATPWTLAPNSVGAKGELLARTTFDEIPGFPVVPADGLDYDRMRVVGHRIVGCEPKPDGCQAQIRLVMQPIDDDGSARDSALHVFYDIDDDAMAEVVAELRRMRSLAPELADSPLDVNTALAMQGFDGPYGQALVSLLLTHAGEENLTRMTFFLRAPPTVEVWFFGGFDRVDGQLEMMDIVGVGQSNQRVILEKTEGPDGITYDFELTPVGIAPENGSALFTTAAADAATEEARAAAFASFLRVENPTIYTPDDLPCAGCHMSAFITADARRRFGLSNADFEGDAFTTDTDIDLSLRGGAETQPSSLRALGYFDREPMLAQRLVNSTADVLKDIETRWPPRERPSE